MQTNQMTDGTSLPQPIPAKEKQKNLTHQREGHSLIDDAGTAPP